MTMVIAANTKAGWDKWRAVLALALPLVFACGMPAAARPAEPRISAAINEYSAAMELEDRNQRLQRFSRAEQLFRQIIEGDENTPPIRNADLYIALGNAALQAERTGPAIVAYRQAIQLDPQNTQAVQNLAYARSLLPDWVRHEESSGLTDALFFWRAMFSPRQIFVLAAIFFLVAALLFATGHVWKQAVLQILSVVPVLFWLVLVVSLVMDPRNWSDQDVTVVTEAIVYAADSENSDARLSRPLPSGAEVRLLQQRGRWSEIQIRGGRSGWVLSSAIEKVTD